MNNIYEMQTYVFLKVIRNISKNPSGIPESGRCSFCVEISAIGPAVFDFHTKEKMSSLQQ